MIKFPKVWYVMKEEKCRCPNEKNFLYIIEIPRIFLRKLEEIPIASGFFNGKIVTSKPNILGMIYLLFQRAVAIIHAERKK